MCHHEVSIMDTNKKTMSGYSLGLVNTARRGRSRGGTERKSPTPLPAVRVGWKKALKKLEDFRAEKNCTVHELFTVLSGSPSRTSLEEDAFISRLHKLLKPHTISTDDAKSLSRKLLIQRQTGYIVAKDLVSLLDIREVDPSHNVFPDWLLQRQDFCAIQHDNLTECSVRNLRVVSAARANQLVRSPADNKCIFNWMNLNCSFLTKKHAGKLMDFCREVEFQEFSENTTIFEQGSTNSPGAYMILTGFVSVSKNGSKLSTLAADSFFGEKSLLGNGPCLRNVTVETLVPTKVLFIARHAFMRIVSNPTQYPARDDIALFLCNYCASFRHFPFQHVLDTSQRISILNYSGLNQVVFHQNDRPRGLYVIRNGVVNIARIISIRGLLKQLDDDIFCHTDSNSMLENDKKNNSTVRLTVATLRRGNIIGESCLGHISNRRDYPGYTAVTGSESVEIYYLSEDECLNYLFKSEYREESRECIKDINHMTDIRRMDDTDLVLKYEKEIRTELMQRKALRRLDLQPIRQLNDSPTEDKSNKSSGIVKIGFSDERQSNPETTHQRVYRDKYKHRLNCLGLGMAGVPAGFLADQNIYNHRPKLRIAKKTKVAKINVDSNASALLQRRSHHVNFAPLS